MAMPQGAWAADSNKPFLKESLAEKIMRVVFEKEDGTERSLICTRNMDLIPEKNHPKRDRVESDALPVWSIVDEDWRSFRFDRVRHVTHITVLSEDNQILSEEGCRTGVVLD